MAVLSAELQIVDQVHEDLGLQLKQIAAIIGADEGTLHRWISGATPSGPRKIYRSRLAALAEFYTELRAAFRTVEVARQWVHEHHPEAFGGRTPLEMLVGGKMERVTGLLWNLNHGMLS